MESQNQDVVVAQEEQNLPALLSQDAVLMSVQRAKERIAAFVLIKQYALAATNKDDWSNIGGNPYLEDTGAEKVAGLFAPEIGRPTINREVFPDGHYMYTCDGIASWGGKSIPVMGTRSSRDKFFIEYDYECDDRGNRKKDDNGRFIKVELSTEELLNRISAGNVRKSALTNYRNNAIKDVLGLEGVTWEELKEFADIDKKDVSGYEFTQTEMSGDAKDKAKEIERMLVEMFGKNYGQQLASLTENRDKSGKLWAGVKSLDKCSERKMAVVYGQVKKAYTAWEKDNKQNKSSTTTKKSSTELLGTTSKDFDLVKEQMDKATDKERIDSLLSTLAGTFNDKAIKALNAYAKAKKGALEDVPF